MKPSRDPGSAHYAAGKTYLVNVPARIKQFQSFHGLVSDGIVGPKTRAKMRAVNTTLIAPYKT